MTTPSPGNPFAQILLQSWPCTNIDLGFCRCGGAGWRSWSCCCRLEPCLTSRMPSLAGKHATPAPVGLVSMSCGRHGPLAPPVACYPGMPLLQHCAPSVAATRPQVRTSAACMMKHNAHSRTTPDTWLRPDRAWCAGPPCTAPCSTGICRQLPCCCRLVHPLWPPATTRQAPPCLFGSSQCQRVCLHAFADLAEVHGQKGRGRKERQAQTIPMDHALLLTLKHMEHIHTLAL